ncbi:hypothetical protein ABZ951_25330, partial [Streptomyces sp. NPDC046215]
MTTGEDQPPRAGRRGNGERATEQVDVPEGHYGTVRGDIHVSGGSRVYIGGRDQYVQLEAQEPEYGAGPVRETLAEQRQRFFFDFLLVISECARWMVLAGGLGGGRVVRVSDDLVP